ncbi:MAG: aspartate carbamoyltransferase catalytic subunit [Phycisphaeraceae bacterium]
MTAMTPTDAPGVAADYRWPHRHLLELAHLNAEDIRFLLQTARGFESVSTRSVKKVPALRGKVVVNLFFEPSTRTRSSFYLAASRLSADTLDFSASSSSLSKGETLRDTARNIEAMGVDTIVVRHNASGAARLVADSVNCSVINAGDGQHEHPTQALLDVYTIGQRLGLTDFDFTGLTVAIVGDITHSRVARSNIVALKKLGAQVLLVGPPTLLPGSFAEPGVEVHHHLDDVLERVDVINMLRVQFERITSPAFPSKREYATLFGLSRERLARMKKDVVVMHPGPINRGLEIESAVADSPNSAILQQVTNGLAVRMATLFLVNSAPT